MVAIRFLGSCVLAALMAAGMGLVGDSPVARAAPAAGVTGPVEAGDVVAPYTPPASNRLKFNFDPDWKFTKKNAAGSEAPDVDDKSWTDVSLPHTFNDVDTFREKDKTPNEQRKFEGKVWYRKHFTLDASWSDRNIYLEFQGIRNTGIFYVNGKKVGEHSNQVGPCGLDVTAAVKFGADNVIAVQVDNNMLAKSPRGVVYDWSAQAFYPCYGGLFKDANLYVTDKLHQTLPLYSNLGTQGTYVYAENIDTGKRTAQVTVESEVANDNSTPQTATLDAWIVDRAGQTVAKQTSAAQAVAAGQKAMFTVTMPMTGVHFWSPDYPYMYRVFTSLTVGGKVTDVYENPLGVRRFTFSDKEGLKINGHPIYLKGYAPRTMMEWAVSGIPQDWMTELDYKMMRENFAYFIRPMHVSPRMNQVESADKFGIVMTCPAGDGEGDARTDAQWQDRVEVMRDVTIYFRNHPSVVFYEASNSQVSVPHMEDMIKVRDKWDPHGGRFAGTRSTDKQTDAIKEYESPMDRPGTSSTMPSWDAEYARSECPRRIWDKITPFLAYDGKTEVTGGLQTVAKGTQHEGGGPNGIHEYPDEDFRLNSSEDLALNLVFKYWERYKLSAFIAPLADRTSKGITVGGAKIFFADSNSDGRLRDMEVARCTGTVDAVRLPKESYYALQVAQNPQPQCYVLGHWNYPEGTVKPVYVICNTDKVKLITYDASGAVLKDYGFGVRETMVKQGNQYAFKFSGVAWKPGKIEAVAYNGDTAVARHSKVTVGAPAALKLTMVPGPGAWRADGADIALIDVEAVDANGLRCPLEEGAVTFKHDGQGTFMGGYNSGIRYSTWKDTINIECGINRVMVRANRTAGAFNLTAERAGLKSATLTITSAPFEVKNGLATDYPRRYGYILGPEPTPIADSAPLLASRPGKTGTTAVTPTTVAAKDTTSVMREFEYTGTHGDTLTPAMPLAHIEHKVKNGSQIYVDRDWKFAGLPDYLVGGDYVQAFERDASENTSTDTIQFFTNKKCYVYIAVDAANGMPTHNNNEDYKWTKEADTITINGRKHDVYKSRLLPEGYNGYFASNGKGITNADGCNQYVVFAVAAP